MSQQELKLVGLTDSDVSDSFSIEKIKGKLVLKYNIHQPLYNLRLLYHIKKTLGYGKVFKCEARQLARFTISDRKVLKEILFPIFDKYPFLTSKYFFYLRFKEAWFILENNSLTIEQQNEGIEKLLNVSLPSDYVSPAISHLSDNSSSEIIKSAVSIYWLVGFIEGKGNLDVLSDQAIFNVEFSIRIKNDKVLLYLIKRLLHIPNKIILDQSGYFILKTKHSRSISNLINVLSVKSGNSKFKGMKSFEFKLWRRAFFYKNTGNINKVAKIQSILQKFRKEIDYFK